MTNLDEKEFIRLVASKLKNDLVDIGKDDVVLLSLKKIKKTLTKANLILKCDMLVESTDVPKEMEPWQIARKSLVACISDLSAKGVMPYVSMISIGIPKKYTRPKIKDLIIGFQLASKEFGVKIVGGDTNVSNELIIDCVMIGFQNNRDSLPKRIGAKPGDLVIASGDFGYSASGLKILNDNMKAEGNFREKAVMSVLLPKPRQKFGLCLARYFSSSIDSSDGLASSLYELARQSKVNFFINYVPFTKDIKDFALRNRLDTKSLVFYGGEEYEIIATISRSHLAKAKTIARKSRLRLIVIGKVENGNGSVFVKEQSSASNPNSRYSSLNDLGYVHSF
jgi:thiamine-monophosphate kinase